MPREPMAYLVDALAACRAIERFVAGRTWEDYVADDLVRSAVERQFEVTGEALNQLRRDVPNLAEGITDLRRIVAFRNVLIHGYAAVNDELVWQAATRQVPRLIENLTAQIELQA